MTLLIIADDEDLLHQLPLNPVDVLISCGDLPDDTILKAAARCGCRHILAVKGNHDGSAPFLLVSSTFIFVPTKSKASALADSAALGSTSIEAITSMTNSKSTKR